MKKSNMRSKAIIPFIIHRILFVLCLYQATKPFRWMSCKTTIINGANILGTPLATDSSNSSQRLLVLILAATDSLNSLGTTVLDTWASELPFDFQFIVSNETLVPTELLPFVTRVLAPEEYPPRRQVFELWKTAFDQFSGYRWYLKIDIDSYVNVDRLKSIVDIMLNMTDSDGYIGNPGFGRAFERKKLGLSVPYCMGMGYFISNKTLRLLRRELSSCFDEPKSNHSDTEIGRCVFKTTGQRCRRIGSYSNIAFDYNTTNGEVHSAAINSELTNGQLHSSTSVLFGEMLDSVLIHPVKKAKSMQAIHRQLQRDLRPVLPMPVNGQNKLPLSRERKTLPAPIKNALRLWNQACVNNPIAQALVSKNHKMKPECPTEKSQSPLISSITTFVLNLRHRQDRFDVISERFKHTGLSLERFEAVSGSNLYGGDDALPMLVPRFGGRRKTIARAMTVGELGYRASMRAVLEKAIKDNHPLLMVLDDDAVPHDNFSELFHSLLNETRCGGNLFSNKYGGVLQLGASVWNEKLWGLVTREKELLRQQSGNENVSACISSNDLTLGSFAVIYHRSIFEEIIEWIDYGPMQPFDWVFGHLARQGLPIRTALPPLVIADVFSTSDVNDRRVHSSFAERASRMRLDLDSFATGLQISPA